MNRSTVQLGTVLLAACAMAVAAGQEAEEHLTNADIVTLVEPRRGASPKFVLLRQPSTASSTYRRLTEPTPAFLQVLDRCNIR